MIDVQRLRILRAVAEHGSFNRAATALHLTPSAVSQHVAVLERSLGAQVVARSTRGVTLTRAGQIMVGAAESVAAELEHAKQQVDRLSTGRTQLTVATFTSGGRVLLPGALARLTAAHPETVLHVREGEPEECLPLVRQGAVDLALAYHFDGPLPGRSGTGSSLRWTPLMEDPLHVVLPHRHPLAGRAAIELDELAGEPWVLGCLKTEAYLRRYAQRAGFDPDVRGTTTDYFFAGSLVAAGLGVSLIPSIALVPRVWGVHIVPIEAPAPARHLGVAVLGHRRDLQVTTLIEALREQAAALGAS
ncbi:LysR family transcriptional regulator [Streptomyces sp. NE06-03E]|uniref:LysR family transcriptional regulator n=2 Tax=Streptomyces TaxID=1883 RepID=A0A652LCZ8_9ACTN|nr:MULTISPECIES: LysR family transcriptional regulator [unclassified Streptomyces]WSS60182.1 LysR family transcriptional regulator [Streptomyces sp. NBC_01177]WSS67292.1 LysR family transcriptional regulator [Streptomyces sp. NBC_01175]WSS74208.1 LysR family transcriptional regulator [Streptomyces sp. NBC_01174]MDX3059453.1 LysR family transcriptional regulator [Streptomyces sp. NE06-03E]MDX3329028.1 LysR family transcriptional regulator [Streptomyces sp. ME02-6979-3A]